MNRSTFIYIMMFLGLILSNSSAFSNQRRCNCSTFPKQTGQQLNQIVDDFFAERQLVGVIVGVRVPGQGTFLKTKGLGNIAKGKPILCRDQVRVGSLTKTFTTTITLQLADEGLLNLDESIARFNTGIPNADQITIRMLCNHTSGLYNYTDDPVFQLALLNDPLQKFTPQELVQIAINRGPIAPPGTEVKYNNTNFIIQGIIIEQITGIPLEELVKKWILKPLKLKHTAFPITPSFTNFTKKFAHGYVVLDDVLTDFTFIDPSSSWASGAMLSTLKDLKKWVKALAKGTLLSREMQKQRLTFVSPPAAPGPFQGPFVKYGLGIEKLGPFLGHEGDIISYNCSINYLLDHDATFIVISNKHADQSFPSDDATELFKRLSKVIFPNEVPW